MATRKSLGFAQRGGCFRPAAFVFLAALAAAACGNDDTESNPFIPLGGGQAGSGGSGGPGGAGGSAGGKPDCFTNPKTHYEIINACTNAVKIKKTPNLNGLNADGSLPPPP